MVKKTSLTTGCNELTKCEGNMLMDISVYCADSGHEASFYDEKKETAFMILTGNVEIKANDLEKTMKRDSVFTERPACLHVPAGVKVTIGFNENSEVLIQKTENEITFAMRYYAPDDVAESFLGENVWENTAKRILRTVFDYQNAPYSNLVLGEVITLPGRWSSYIPHHHPQPEVYFYKFDNPKGFGCSFIGDNAYKISHNSYAAIEGGLTHPQASAPGYTMYYCWMIRHLENNPWTTRIDDPDHTWLLDKQ